MSIWFRSADCGAASLAESRPRTHLCFALRASPFSFDPHPSQNDASAGLSLLHFVQSIWLRAEFLEQGFGVFEVGGVEAFGEPAVDLGEHRARHVATALFREHPREAC